MSFYDELKRRNVVRVSIAYVAVSWVILQAVDVILGNVNAPVWIFHSILLLLGIGFILAVVFSWAFELTPEGIKRESEVDRTQSITHQTGRRLTQVIVLFLAVGAVYFVFDWMKPETAGDSGQASTQTGTPAGDNTIAVLPFTNISGDSANEPFAVGIHDDLLTYLSKIKALKITSRTSVLQYRGTTKTIPQIANELGVAHILEGSIQRSGDRVRINMQLIDADTDEHLWAEMYDRGLTAENLFAVQGDIATEVAKAMRATLLPEEETALNETPTQSMAAYDLYLLGRYHWNLATAESAELARGYFEQAIEEDPNYVLALSGLADAYIALVDYGNLTGPEYYPLAQQAIDRAMAQDDMVSEVWTSLGQLRLESKDQPGALEAFERAIELDEQNFWAWYRTGSTMVVLRRFDEAINAFQIAYSLEPMSRPVNQTLGWRYFHRGDFVRARQHFARVDQLQEKDPTQWKEAIARTFLESGQIARAIVDARKVLALDPNNVDAMWILVQAYITLGDLAEARLWVERSEAIDSFSIHRNDLFWAQGDFEGAIAFVDDFMMRAGNRNPGLVGLNFQNASFGKLNESAVSFAKEFMSHFGGMGPVNLYDPYQWNKLTGLEFVVGRWPEDQGDGQSDALRYQAMQQLDEVMRTLVSFNSQGFEHPDTIYSLAVTHVLQGNYKSALTHLGVAVDKGFLKALRFRIDPMLDPLRGDPKFVAIEAQMQERIQAERDSLAQTQLAAYNPTGQRPVVLLPRELLDKYAGHYTDGNIVLHFYLDDRGQFTFKIGQLRSPQSVVASADGEFYIPDQSADTFRFAADENNVVSHVLWESGGSSTRFKAVAPPPATVELDRAILERYVGTYRAELVSDAARGGSTGDVWIIKIFIDEDGTVWSDYDNQPNLVIVPISETEFYTPGFMSRMTFVLDPQTGVASHFIDDWGGADVHFERQE